MSFEISLAQVLSSYLTLNLLIILGFLGIGITFFILKKCQRSITSRAQLEIHYAVLSSLALIMLVIPFLPQKQVFQPTAKVWATESIKTFYQDYESSQQNGFLSFNLGAKQTVMSADIVSHIWQLVAFLIFAFGIFILAKDLFYLYKIQKGSQIVKKIGRVCIWSHDQIQVPFSYFNFHANVVIPSYLISQIQDYKIVVAHELQHHRQKDTLWVYAFWFLKIVCVINPVIYIWIRQISEVQEFACDETLIGRKKVDSRAYARCLLGVAQTASYQKSHPVCATGLTFLMERNLLKRRIESMFTQTSVTKSSVKFGVGFVLAILMTFSAYAAKSFVQDRRISMKEAVALAKNSKSSADFPIVVNDLVLKELNRYAGTPEGRDFMRKSLTRMENYRALVNQKIQQYNAPEEFLAIPIIESGYQNLPQSQNKAWGAGLWMFIESTARNYGLRVDAELDERLEPEVLTDAAMRYLSANKSRFRDWPLALLSYNIGEQRVQRGMDKLNTRDAWVLSRHGFQGDQYLARLMAAILIMKNPSLLD